jgi:Family of unknown function (DUF695)
MVVPEPTYTHFDVVRDGSPAVVVVNSALLEFAQLGLFPWHLRVTIAAREPGQDGMPTVAESTLLSRIGDEIEAVLLGALTLLGAPNALFLARTTGNETRELHFQVHDPEVANDALQETLVNHGELRDWDYRMAYDSELQEAARIFSLFPSAHERDY